MRMVLFVGLFLALIPSLAQAGTGTGRVLKIANFQGTVIITVESISGTPSCNTTNRIAISPSAPGYTSTVSMLTSAFLSGSRVSIAGKNTCDYWSNSEDLDYITLCPISGTCP
jgi:hypothetical protein